MKPLRLVRFFLLVFVLASFDGSAAARPTNVASARWRDKVAPDLLREMESQDELEFIVFLNEQADVSAAAHLVGKVQRGRYVYDVLSMTAQRTQADILARLKDGGAEFRAYWIANMIWVRGGSALLESVASRPEIAAVSENPRVKFDAPVRANEPSARAPAAVEPNIAHIRAPELWALGVTGQGTVIGGQDTGYDWDHAALRDKYRGWNGVSADHNYNWHDAIHSGGGVCGADSGEPCDDYGHGTHTMGTMVGDDGAGNQIGVAPGARWIGCRNMDQGVGTPVTYAECFQWFVAPTDMGDENPDPSLAPDVINNSWACPPREGCDEAERAVMETVVENVRAAGITVVSSAGNSGSNCGTVQFPPAIYDATFSVGATGIDLTNNSDYIAGFSSRGPVTIDERNLLKPDVVAPGVNVRSSLPGTNSYGSLSGTSMAAPHVSGLVALLVSANPALAGNVAGIEAAITGSAVPLMSDQDCGGISGSAVPNNTFGYGRIDALRAYERIALLYKYYFPISPLAGV
ncbi:MAG TPA: S8 family serine peptidase [Candidatus Binatia bacterium]|nr:S8 family serine peptidase [Candidatus Binatia bacterium]